MQIKICVMSCLALFIIINALTYKIHTNAYTYTYTHKHIFIYFYFVLFCFALFYFAIRKEIIFISTFSFIFIIVVFMTISLLDLYLCDCPVHVCYRVLCNLSHQITQVIIQTK